MRASLLVRVTSAAAALVLASGLAACGDDDEEETTGATTTTAEEETGGGGDLAATCDAQIALTKGFTELFSSIEEPEGPPSPELVAQIQQGFDRSIAPALAEIEENAPDEIRADVEAGVAILQRFREKPDPSIFGDPEFEEVGKRIDGYLYDNCESGTSAEVSAAEYAFEGLPEEVEAGPVRFRFENKGKEVHEIVLLSRKAGVTETFDEILALPEEQGQQKVDVQFGAFESPGDTGFAVFDLPAGEYLAVCFVPRGTTSEEQEVEGPPHFTLGMRQAIKAS